MNTSTAPGRSKKTHALSCVNCRQKKVRCTKTHPCPQCARGGLECVFPSRKKDRRPRTNNKNNELLSRLAKLEVIVSKVDPTSLKVIEGSNAGGAASSSSAAAQNQQVVAPPRAITDPALHYQNELTDLEKRRPTAPMQKDDPAARYLSGEFWANLSSEVEGIKHALAQPSDSDDDDDLAEGSTPESSGFSYASPSGYVTSTAMFGNASAVGSDQMLHPPPDRMKQLFSIYWYNMDSLLKILHKPTIIRQLESFLSSPNENPLDSTTEALFFSIYFAAITTLTPEKCMTQLGEERAPLVMRYRQSTEIALAKADYLNSTSLVSLQALTIYVTCLRNHHESRVSWALLSLVLRLSQAIGLHRDGDGSAYLPYEAEMRRRLWSQIIVLDVRAVEDRGTEPMIAHDDYNTLPMTNIDDSAFGPETTIPVQQLAKEGPSDTTFSLCTYKCSGIFLYLHAPKSKFAKGASGFDLSAHTQAQVTEEEMVKRVRQLEEQFVENSDPEHFPSALAARVVRLCTLIYWLSIQYPFQVRQPLIKPRVSREHMLQTAISIMELQVMSIRADFADRFTWWTDTYVQWHPLAVALAELCIQTYGPLVERAWTTIERVLPLWAHKVADTKRGALWRPIKKLLRKARAARAEAQIRRLNLNENRDPQPQETVVVAEPPPPPSEPSAWQPNVSSGFEQQGAPPSDFNMVTQWALEPMPAPALDSSMPPPLIMENAHNLFDIDFGEDIAVTPGFGMMDWSNWNEFVNDAAGGLDSQSA